MLSNPLGTEQSTEAEVCPHGATLCARNNTCANVDEMQGRSHSISEHGAFYALIACFCVVMALLSGSSPTRLASTDRLTRSINDRVERIEAPNRTAVQMVSLDFRFAEGLHEEVAELSETTDDDEIERCLLVLDAVLRLDVPTFGSQTGLYESPADRARAPFRLRAFSGRGSPSA